MRRILLAALICAVSPTWAQIVSPPTAGVLAFTCQIDVPEGAAGYGPCPVPSAKFVVPAAGDKVLSGVANNKFWRTFSTLAATDTLRTCAPAAVSADRTTCSDPQWIAKSNVATAPAVPPAPPGATNSATLRWVAPTQNTDGSALTGLAGFRVYQAGAAIATLANPGLLTYAVESLPPGETCFTVRSYTAQAESLDSDRVCKTIAAPALPTAALSVSPADGVESVTPKITWSSTNATSCTASGAWAGTKAISGEEVVAPITRDATYSLACTGPGGTAQTNASIAVSPRPMAPIGLTAQ